MTRLTITDFFLYRWRLVIGYSVIGLVLVGLLLFAGFYIPGGLTSAEMASAVDSANIALTNPSSLAVTHLPFHLLQQASMSLFGVGVFAIKLPSLVIGFLTAIGMVFLLRRWFNYNIAILASILTVTTGQFLFVAQNGSPAILYIFWTVLLLLSATMIAQRARFGIAWKAAFVIIAALSLYTPLSVYILLALAATALIHPRLRYVVRKLPKLDIIWLSVIGLVLVAPLGYTLYQHPDFGLQLLGIPSAWPNLGDNIMQLVRQYLDVITPGSGTLMTPVFGLGSLALIIMGILHLLRSRYTARSYMITIWVLLLLPILIINPAFTSITFVPLLLIMAIGIDTLLREWYRLFPRNPYARVVGLLPLVVLIGGLVLTGVERYVYGYHYDPQSATNFSRDITLLKNELGGKSGDVTLVTSNDERAFYSMAAANDKTFPGLKVTVASEAPAIYPTSTLIITKASFNTNDKRIPQRIVTSTTSSDADRFYIYKNS